MGRSETGREIEVALEMVWCRVVMSSNRSAFEATGLQDGASSIPLWAAFKGEPGKSTLEGATRATLALFVAWHQILVSYKKIKDHRRVGVRNSGL